MCSAVTSLGTAGNRRVRLRLPHPPTPPFLLCAVHCPGHFTAPYRPVPLQYFYEEQLHRMECLSQESVGFTDVLAQMSDMLEPKVGIGLLIRLPNIC